MFRYSKVVVYTVVLILLCGLGALWLGIDPSVDKAMALRLTLGDIFLCGYLLYRHHRCTQSISFEQGHLVMGGREPRQMEDGYTLVYRSTYLVFSGLGWFSREWRSDTGMLVFRNSRRYIPGMSLFDRLFPQSSEKKQVLFFGTWKLPSGEVASDQDLQRRIISVCEQHKLTIKTVWLEFELLGLILVCAGIGGTALWMR